jgi:hypothetical protein
MARELLPIRLEEDLIRRIDALAARTGQTRTALVERLILVGLGEVEDIVGLLSAPVVGALLAKLVGTERGQKLLAEVIGESVEPAKRPAQREWVANVRKSRRKGGSDGR